MTVGCCSPKFVNICPNWFNDRFVYSKFIFLYLVASFIRLRSPCFLFWFLFNSGKHEFTYFEYYLKIIMTNDACFVKRSGNGWITRNT